MLQIGTILSSCSEKRFACYSSTEKTELMSENNLSFRRHPTLRPSVQNLNQFFYILKHFLLCLSGFSHEPTHSKTGSHYYKCAQTVSITPHLFLCILSRIGALCLIFKALYNLILVLPSAHPLCCHQTDRQLLPFITFIAVAVCILIFTDKKPTMYL